MGLNDLLALIVILIIIGAALYLVNNVITMVEWMRTVINVVVIVFVCIWLLGLFTGTSLLHYRVR